MSENYNAKSVQEALRMLGHPLATDGINGPKTQAAIKAFQKDSGIGVDGIVGPKTAAAFVKQLGEISVRAAGLKGYFESSGGSAADDM
ncbi:MAG: peptidoglycan-binding protein [Leptospiraceae bacterium]|nr:peptidoglycan-binding protein [Leptospiraceae bacterium]